MSKKRGNYADFEATTTKKDYEAPAGLWGRWREHEEERKHISGHILEAAGNPGQAPESLKDLALEKRR